MESVKVPEKVPCAPVDPWMLPAPYSELDWSSVTVKVIWAVPTSFEVLVKGASNVKVIWPS